MPSSIPRSRAGAASERDVASLDARGRAYKRAVWATTIGIALSGSQISYVFSVESVISLVVLILATI